MVGILFQNHSKNKITDHGKANGKDHIANILYKENGKDAVKNERKLYAKIYPIYITEACKNRVKYKIYK